MKNLFLWVPCLVALNVYGQNQYAGVTGGILLSNNNIRNSQNLDDRSAFAGGLTYTFHFNERLTFGADRLYLQRGFRDDIYFTDQSGYVEEEKLFRFNFDYVAVPLKVGYNFGQQLYGFVNVGVMPSFLDQSVIKSETFDANGKQTDSDEFSNIS